MSKEAGVDRFAARGGLALLHRRWQPASAVRALAIVHGLAEHSARYEHVAGFFSARGYAVHAFDQRGHGRSEGPRAFAPDFEHLLDDVDRFLARVRQETEGLPLVLLGHSMGGLEVATLLARRRPKLAAAVLSGAPLGPTDVFPIWQRALISGLSRLAPRVRLPSSIDPQGLSRDPAVVADYVADPLVDKRYTARLVAELTAAIDWIADRPAEIEIPLLVLHGEADPICPPDLSRRFAEAVASAGSEYRGYPELRHEILNEPERERVMSDMHAWIEKNVPAVRVT